MNQKQKRFRKILIALRLTICGNGYKKAEFLKKCKIFSEFGNNNYWFPRVTPADPEKIKIHNNVKVATDVYFCTHDVLHNLFNDQHKDVCGGGYNRYSEPIEIFDNVFLGARSIIMYGVKVGPNAIVAAGSVVTKDVPEGSVVGGNPARVIGQYSDVLEKRKKYGVSI